MRDDTHRTLIGLVSPLLGLGDRLQLRVPRPEPPLSSAKTALQSRPTIADRFWRRAINWTVRSAKASLRVHSVMGDAPGHSPRSDCGSAAGLAYLDRHYWIYR